MDTTAPNQLRERFESIADRWIALDETARQIASDQADAIAEYQRWCDGQSPMSDEQWIRLGVDVGYEGAQTAASVIANRATVGFGEQYVPEELRRRGFTGPGID